MKIEVGNCPGLPEEIITGIVKLENGNFAVSYNDGEYSGTLETFNPMQRGDVQELLARRPELLATVVESVETVEVIEIVPVAEEEQAEAAIISPTVAINVQNERYYLAINPQSHDIFDEIYRTRLGANRYNFKTTKLPTTEECMVFNLNKCNARKQEDNSWSLPPRVTVDILGECVSFDIIKLRPVAPKVDPLIDAHIKYSSNISGY